MPCMPSTQHRKSIVVPLLLTPNGMLLQHVSIVGLCPGIQTGKEGAHGLYSCMKTSGNLPQCCSIHVCFAILMDTYMLSRCESNWKIQ